MDLYFATQGSILKKLMSKRQQPSVQSSNLTKSTASGESRDGSLVQPLSSSPEEKDKAWTKVPFAGVDSDHSTSSECLKKRRREAGVGMPPESATRKKSMQSFLSESESPSLKPSLYQNLATGAIRKDSVEELLRSSHNSRMAEEETKTLRLFCESSKLSDPDNLDRSESEQNDKAQARMHNLFYLLDEANTIAKEKGGLCLSEFCGGRHCPLNFRCVLNHRFTKTLDELNSSWCITCEGIYSGLKEQVERTFQGRLIEEILKPKMTVECKNGHRFSSEYKSIVKKECSGCLKQKKDDGRNRMFEEANKKMFEDKLLQEKLLEEARLKMLDSQKNSKDKGNRCAQVYQTFMQEIEKTAIKLAKAFIEEQKQTDQSVNDCQLVEFFKYEMMPDEILTNYLMSLPCEMLKQEYRRVAKIIHPDKSFHPRANFAFQKFSNCYSEAIRKLNLV